MVIQAILVCSAETNIDVSMFDFVNVNIIFSPSLILGRQGKTMIIFLTSMKLQAHQVYLYNIYSMICTWGCCALFHYIYMRTLVQEVAI